MHYFSKMGKMERLEVPVLLVVFGLPLWWSVEFVLGCWPANQN